MIAGRIGSPFGVLLPDIDAGEEDDLMSSYAGGTFRSAYGGGADDFESLSAFGRVGKVVDGDGVVDDDDVACDIEAAVIFAALASALMDACAAVCSCCSISFVVISMLFVRSFISEISPILSSCQFRLPYPRDSTPTSPQTHRHQRSS